MTKIRGQNGRLVDLVRLNPCGELMEALGLEAEGALHALIDDAASRSGPEKCVAMGELKGLAFSGKSYLADWEEIPRNDALAVVAGLVDTLNRLVEVSNESESYRERRTPKKTEGGAS